MSANSYSNVSFSFIAASNYLHYERNYINQYYLPLKYTFDNLKTSISSGRDAADKLFIITKVVINGEKHVIYIFQNSFAFQFASKLFNDTYFLSSLMMNLMDRLAFEKNFIISKKDYPKLKDEYDNKRIYLYSYREWYSAIIIQRAWLKYSLNPKYKYCHIYNINKLICETNISNFSNEFKELHYKYLFAKTMISLKNKFLKSGFENS